ncbi:hypothetical protein [Parasedimentitalea psychrophila]|nr:hypothetical protein [Parasedimentitalea psychrophila]
MTGNPPSAGYEPRKSDIADWMQEYESIAAGGGLAYIDGALADLQARVGAVDDQFGLVLNTSDEAGIYERIAGTWVKNAAIPTLFLESAFADLAVESAAAAALSEAAALTASGEAESFKAQAELAALAAGAKIFASEAAGLAATVEGEVFIVQSGSATLVYQNLSAAAVLLGSVFDKSELLQAANNLSDVAAAAAARAALGVDPAGTVNTVDLASKVTGLLPGANMVKSSAGAYGVTMQSSSAQNIAGTANGVTPSVLGVKEMIDEHGGGGPDPAETGSPYYGLHPYDGVTVGDGKTGTLYDKDVDGNVSSIQTPNFEPGHRYVISLVNYSHNGAPTDRPVIDWYDVGNSVIATTTLGVLDINSVTVTSKTVNRYVDGDITNGYVATLYAVIRWENGANFDKGRIHLFRELDYSKRTET